MFWSLIPALAGMLQQQGQQSAKKNEDLVAQQQPGNAQNPQVQPQLQRFVDNNPESFDDETRKRMMA